MKPSQHPALAQLASAYFYQSWDEDYPDEWAVVDEFVRSEPSLKDSLCVDIDDVLRTLTDDADVRDYLLQLGSFVTNSPEINTSREWLQAVRDHATTTGDR